MQSKMVCRRCGVVLALTQDGNGEELIVGSPVGGIYHAEIVPRGRILLRCSRCGSVREWHPPPRSRKKRTASDEGEETD